MKGDVFFPPSFSPTPPLAISKHPDSPPSSPDSTPPSSPHCSSLSSSYSSPTSGVFLSSASPFLSHSPPTSPSRSPSPMAATLFFPPPAMTSTPFSSRRLANEGSGEQADVEDNVDDVEDVTLGRRRLILRMHTDSDTDTDSDDSVDDDLSDEEDEVEELKSSEGEDVVSEHEEELEEEEEEDLVEAMVVEDGEEVENQGPTHHDIHHHSDTGIVAAGVAAAIGTVAPRVFRRVTLKPRRTLSLSPTPAGRVGGDMSMGRNLRAACWLDFTDRDADDGLARGVDREGHKKQIQNDENENDPACADKTQQAAEEVVQETDSKNRVVSASGTGTVGTRVTCTDGVTKSTTVQFCRKSAFVLGASSSMPTLTTNQRRSSVKRPLEVTLPCQEIQYLDISYQKVQYSPIPHKKIAYVPVDHHAIHYCDVSYVKDSERPLKRKPLTRSHSFGLADLRDRVDSEFFSYKFR